MTAAAVQAAFTEQLDASAPTSLRERKKVRTRTALVDAAQRLFLERGYDQTTLNDISAEAEVTTQTLLRYFPSKAQLALTPLRAPLEELARFLTSPTRRIDTIDVWRWYVGIEAAEAATPTMASTATYVANLRAYREWVDKDPVVVAQLSELEMWLQRVLASAIARDGELDEDDLHSTLVAAMLVAGRRAVWDRWLERASSTDSLVDDQLAVVDYAIASLPRRDARRLLRTVQ